MSIANTVPAATEEQVANAEPPASSQTASELA